MNLQENIRRILRERIEVPVSIKRRIYVINKSIDITLDNMHPCDYINDKDFFEGFRDIFGWVISGDNVRGVTREVDMSDIYEYIDNYKVDYIEQYYIDRCY